jgi:RNA polymerase sigma factor (sigma-70 family)
MELETPSLARSVVETVLLDPQERSRLIGYARLRFGIDRDDAEDLLQETALEVLLQRALVRSPKGFVFTVFHARCSRFLRRNVTDRRLFRQSEPSEPERSPSDSGPPACETIDSRLALQEALEEISAGCRKLLFAYYFEGKSLREAADATARAYSGVWKTIDRCLKKLRQCLA